MAAVRAAREHFVDPVAVATAALVEAARAGMARFAARARRERATLPEVVAREQARPLDFDEVRRILPPKSAVLTYSDALQNRHLAELLREHPGGVVLLVRWRPSFGHYVALFERGGRPALFDSYGARADGSAWRRLPQSQLAELGQAAPRLLEDAAAGGRGIYWSDYAIQDHSPQVQTCGRWSCLRLWLPYLSESQFVRAILSACEHLEVTPDELATFATADD